MESHGNNEVKGGLKEILPMPENQENNDEKEGGSKEINRMPFRKIPTIKKPHEEGSKEIKTGEIKKKFAQKK
jgi:hypothetical protein